MKRLHLLTHEFRPFIGGIGTYVEETALALQQAGAAVTVWAPDYGKRHIADDAAAGLSVRRVRMRGKQDWACRLRMATALKKTFGGYASGCCFVLAEPGPIRVWMYARLLNLPLPDRLVLILHGSEVLALGPRRRFRQLLASADRIGVVSSAVREAVLAIDGSLAAKLVMVPGAVRSAWSAAVHAPKAAHRSHRLILQVGRLHPRKGQTVFVDALHRLADFKDRIHVQLIGPPGKRVYEAEVARAIATCPVPVERIRHASDADLLAAYQQAEVVVMPSMPFRKSFEGLGLALVEAGFNGCAVIASDIGGTSEALIPGETGLLVPPGDPDALAAALRELLSNPRRSAAMGLAGTQFVRARFSWQRNARLLLS